MNAFFSNQELPKVYVENETDQEVFFKHLYFCFSILSYIKYNCVEVWKTLLGSHTLLILRF